MQLFKDELEKMLALADKMEDAIPGDCKYTATSGNTTVMAVKLHDEVVLFVEKN